jgi:hypothetical protein
MINYLRIKSIRKYLTKVATEIFVLSLVISHLDYCNVILYGIAQSEIGKMQRIQSMSAKLVLNRRKFDSSREAICDLHCLPINSRMQFKSLTFMYNCYVGEAPLYLTELLIKHVPIQKLCSAELSEGYYNVPFNRHKTISDRRFGTIGPRLWNNLTLDIKQSRSLDTFKAKLKTHLILSQWTLFQFYRMHSLYLYVLFGYLFFILLLHCLF